MDLLKHQAREGYWEGTVSALVAICALMYTPTLTSLDLFSLSFNVLSSVVLSIPNGLKAEALLELGGEAGYYERGAAEAGHGRLREVGSQPSGSDLRAPDRGLRGFAGPALPTQRRR